MRLQRAGFSFLYGRMPDYIFFGWVYEALYTLALLVVGERGSHHVRESATLFIAWLLWWVLFVILCGGTVAWAVYIRVAAQP